MSHLIAQAGHLIRVGGHLANSHACCRVCIECQSSCDEGTRPPTFDVTIDHCHFFTDPDSCAYTAGVSPYAGVFELEWLGAYGIDGDCAWYYCTDDPCSPGDKYVILFRPRLGGNYTLDLLYECEAASCEPQDVLDCLNLGLGVPGGFGGFDEFVQDSESFEGDCCLFDRDLIYLSFSGTAHVTLQNCATPNVDATNCTPV